jgi:hypothetical protein
MRRHQFPLKKFTQEKENIKKDRIEKSPKAVGAFFFLRQALKHPGFCEKFHKQHAEGGEYDVSKPCYNSNNSERKKC